MLDRLRAEWPLKLLSLGVAFGLWVAITGEDRAVKDLDLPLEVLLRDDQILAASPPTKVTVRLEGPRPVIRKLEPVELAVRLDLRDGPIGEMDVQLSERNLAGRPGRVEVAFFNPDRVSLVVARKMQRELPVEADLIGSPPPGFALYGVHVRPAKLTVEGAEGAVATLTLLRTNPLSLEHRTRTFTETVGAVPDRSDVRIVDPRQLEVRVVVDVTPVERAFDDVPIVLPDGGTGASLTPRAVRVVLSGPPDVLARVTPGQIRVVADAAGAVGPGATRRAKVQATVIDLTEDQLARVKIKSVRPGTVGLRGGAAGGPE